MASLGGVQRLRLGLRARRECLPQPSQVQLRPGQVQQEEVEPRAAQGLRGSPSIRGDGRVVPGTGNAVWGMQFIWPIKSDYRIVYVSPDYQRTIIGREKRDNVWIMARMPEVAEADLGDLRDRVGREGYDLGKLQLVPQRWPEPANAPARAAEKECS